MRRGLKLAAALVISAGGLSVYLGQTSSARSNGIYKIEPRVLKDLAAGEPASIAVYVKSQADVSAAYGMRDQDARGWYVYRRLKEHAARTQAPVVKLLESRGVPYRSFWAANVIFTRGGSTLVHDLAARSDVAAIEANDASRWVASTKGTATEKRSPATVENGVTTVRAPDLWKLGYRGQGIVIGNQDTGMRWTHNALKPHYRGWNGSTPDHNFNWHDSIHGDINGNGSNPCGFNSIQPCDDGGHGTHTTGTAVGDDGAGNRIGVAPGAKWIGCHNMDQGVGRPETYTECFQWFIAPTDLQNQHPDPTRRPDIINDSWGCPASELCAPTTLQTVVENARAAGIFVEASAGNGGPGCGSVIDPPAIYDASYSTGAIDAHRPSHPLASSSSRGPVTVDGSNRIKPDIVAPGVNVRSSTNASDTSYAQLNGTSMAGPHVVGVVALLWSDQALGLRRDIDRTEAVLNRSANRNVTGGDTGCGGVSSVPNNHFGHGLVDALAAYAAAGGRPSPPRPKCVVPSVLHLKLAKAKARLRKRHCRAGKITRRHSSLRNRGRVVKQTPKASSKRRPNGFRVRLTVGR